MKARLASFLFIIAFVTTGMVLTIQFKRGVPEPRRPEFPVEGLVIQDDRRCVFERVAAQDLRMIRDLGFPKALATRNAAKVRHLIIYLDCHYFFIADGRVLVMTLSGNGPTPRVVETKQWRGAPHDFRDYRTELLPSTGAG